MRRCAPRTPRRRRSARARLLVLVCAAFALAYGARAIARDAARRREDTAALARLDRLDPNGSLRAQWERGGTASARTTRRFCPRTARRRSRRSYRSARSRAVGARAPWLSPTRRARPRTGPARDATRATRKHVGSVSSVFAFRAARRRRGRDGVCWDDVNAGAFAHESLFVRSTNGQGERDPRAALGPRARDRARARSGDSERGAEDSRATRDALRRFFPPAGGDFGHGDSVWFQDSDLSAASPCSAATAMAPVPASASWKKMMSWTPAGASVQRRRVRWAIGAEQRRGVASGA